MFKFRKLRFLRTPRNIIGWIMYNYCPKLMGKRYWQEMNYLLLTRLPLDLDNPRTFNEKLQWLKLYDRNPLYTKLVDKYLVKEWVAEKIGKEYVIPTLKMYKSPDEIDLSELPNQFVLKCNHDSGSVIICTDKSRFDLVSAKKKLAERLKFDTYAFCGEWAYKNVPRCIIAEKFMEEEGQQDLMDYKFFCFDGVPRVMYMSQDHAEHCTTDFFDMKFNRLPIRMQASNSDVPPPKPKQFEELKRLAKILSKGIPQVRVDFYVIKGHVYFGEMTFYHCGGMVQVQPLEWNLKLGEMIHLPQKKDNG